MPDAVPFKVDTGVSEYSTLNWPERVQDPYYKDPPHEGTPKMSETRVPCNSGSSPSCKPSRTCFRSCAQKMEIWSWRLFLVASGGLRVLGLGV